MIVPRRRGLAAVRRRLIADRRSHSIRTVNPPLLSEKNAGKSLIVR